jgi:oxalate decarboxylase/phosphoglucose isomerase-like protein (cupin superfamily)
MSSTTERSRLRVGGDDLEFRVTSHDSGGSLVAFDVLIPPGGGPPLLHRHPPFELYLVRGGTLAFYLEDGRGEIAREVAEPGRVVAIPGGREHTVRNESDGEARAFVVLAPGAEMEAFVRAAADLAVDGSPRPEDILALAEAHGMEMTRPVEVLDVAG